MYRRIWDALRVSQATTGNQTQYSGPVFGRWRNAFAAEPRLAEDIVAYGGVLQLRTLEITDGLEDDTAPIDPTRLAFEAGKRDMALRLLALGGVTTSQLIEMMEQTNVDD